MIGTRCVLFVMALFIAAGPADASSIVLDQSAPLPVPGHSWGGGLGCPCVVTGDYFDVAQTFTVGQTGFLTGVELFIASSFGMGFPESDLLFDIRPTADGVPVTSNAAALFAITISSVSVSHPDPAFFFIDVSSANLMVTTGERLAIVLRAQGGNFGFGGQPSNPYDGGQLFGRLSLTNPVWSVSPYDRFDGDVAFRTYVEVPVQPVPEPSTILLFGTGLVACVRRWRQLPQRLRAQ